MWLPVLVSAFLNALSLLILGAVLLFLAQIENNLGVARERQEAAIAAAQATPIEVEPAPAPVITEALAPAAVLAAEALPIPIAEALPIPAVLTAEALAETPLAAAEMIETPAPITEVSAPPVILPQIEISEATVSEAVAEVEAALPEAIAEVEAVLPEAALPEAIAEVEAALPEAALPEAALPEAIAEVEAALPEAALPEAIAEVEAALPEAALPEAIAEVEAAPDAGVTPLLKGKGAPLRLPGAEEAARIAAELKALKAASGSRPRVDVAAPVETPDLPQADRTDDLTLIKGIGPSYARKLREVGITSFAALAEAGDDLLEALTEGNLERVVRDDWRGQARRLNA
ncbi:MAG: hypothetical protein AUK03_05685 [Anaerolineae bacterium CG2_30_64_16]|nr:MAG: hypothetical protein AUK03_05685 [Anaerolineae bacterium CG2_30_64_16]